MSEPHAVSEPNLAGRLRELVAAGQLGLIAAASLAFLVGVADLALDAVMIDPPSIRWLSWMVAGLAPQLLLHMIAGLDSSSLPTFAYLPTALVLALLRPAKLRRIGQVAFVTPLAVLALAGGSVGFLTRGGPLVLVGVMLVIGAWLAVRRWPVHARRIAGASAFAFCLTSTALYFVLDITMARARSAAHSLEHRRVVEARAYDVHPLPDGPSGEERVVFSTQGELFELTRGSSTVVRPLEWAGQSFYERFTDSPIPGRPFVSDPGHGVLWLGLELANATETSDPWASHPAALIHDHTRNWLIVANEWSGRLLIQSSLDGSAVATLDVSPHLMTVPWLALDGDRLFVTSMLGDGDLRVLTLDGHWQEQARVRNLFAYQTLVDHAHGVLWTARPTSGELLRLDLDSLEVRGRTRLAVGLRDIVYDPVRDELFVNAYPSGELFRIAAATGEPLERGSCGWRCRSLAIEPRHRVLWAASHDGIFRLPLDEPL
jgi:hypothetical protein